MENWIVLIADIERSRQVQPDEREKLQKRLGTILDNLSEANSAIVSPYTITLGDEFQAVFKNADGICIDLLKIMANLHPVTVRFSLGVGPIETPINREQAIGMDGPAFHVARKGIDFLKDSGFLFNINMEGKDTVSLAMLNNILKLLSQQLRGWNKNRLRILYMLKEGYDYKAITEELNISQPAFYKNKKAGLLDVIDELSENISTIINGELEE